MVEGDTDLNSRNKQIKVIQIAFLFLLLFVLLVVILWKAFHVLLLFFAAMMFASFLRGIGKFISKKTALSEGWATLTGALVLGVILVAAGFLLMPRVISQGHELRVQIPHSIDVLTEKFKSYDWAQPILENIQKPSEILKSGQVWSYTKMLFGTVFGVFGDLYIIFLIGVFFALTPKLYLEGIVLLFPIPRRNRIREVFNALSWTLRNWLLGVMINITITGILTWIVLSIIGVPLALVLGLITGILNFIPNFGPIIAAIPVALVSFALGPEIMLYALIGYFAVNIVTSNVLPPLIQKKLIQLPAAFIMIAQTLLGAFTGALGLALATPLAAMIMVAVRMLYIEDHLGDHAEIKAEEKTKSNPLNTLDTK